MDVPKFEAYHLFLGLSLHRRTTIEVKLSFVFVGAGTIGKNCLKFRSESAVLFAPASPPADSPDTVVSTAILSSVGFVS